MRLLINEVGSGFRVQFIEFCGAGVGSRMKPRIFVEGRILETTVIRGHLWFAMSVGFRAELDGVERRIWWLGRVV